MAKAKELADQARAEVDAGKPFETVARKWSEESPTAEARGRIVEVAALTRSTVMPQPVLDAVFQGKDGKDGDVLGPLRTFDGWYIVKIERRIPAPTFEECAPRVREDLLTAKVREWKAALRKDVEVAEDL